MSTSGASGRHGTSSVESADGTASEERVPDCRAPDVVPVEIDAERLESTAKPYLRELKADLLSRSRQPAAVVVDARFDEPGSLAVQREADRLREYVRAAAFLGAGRVTIEVDAVASPERVRPAVSALAERARREGVALSVTGEADLPVPA